MILFSSLKNCIASVCFSTSFIITLEGGLLISYTPSIKPRQKTLCSPVLLMVKIIVYWESTSDIIDNTNIKSKTCINK